MTPGTFPPARRFRLISFPPSRRRTAARSIMAISILLLLYEQGTYRILEVDPLDRFTQQGGHGEDPDLPALRLRPQRDGVRYDEFLDLRLLQPLDGGAG